MQIEDTPKIVVQTRLIDTITRPFETDGFRQLFLLFVEG